MTDKPHIIARKFQDLQRQSARPYSCPLCSSEASFNESKLFDHVSTSHSEQAPTRDSKAWKELVANASKQRTARKLIPENPPGVSNQSSNDSMKLNLGEDISRSRAPSSKPGSGPEKNIQDMKNLSLSQGLDIISHSQSPSKVGDRKSSLASNPLKRSAVGESSQVEQLQEQGDTTSRNRRTKGLSGSHNAAKDPDFDRKPPPHKRLFDPNTDKTSYGSNPKKTGLTETPSRRPESRPQGPKVKREYETKTSQRIQQPPVVVDNFARNDNPHLNQSSPRDHSGETDESYFDQDPELLLQPETRPISHEQLVVEVKGIYAGLVMVEAKCVDVDEKQSAAAQERDPSKQTILAPEQWQALIALHKTLLHEHHDFFLASQHPSASPALRRLAAKNSMPARMWRHGIHAFLEVLRHRLPESLDHMLAFIYIAYSMMALLYETVPAFEDTWIECLGDLGRYRMAIEDEGSRDREVWSGVAKFWYGKAADKSPNVGRLYHHLAILAKPHSIQQLSLYARSLTCISPFDSARTSIVSLFSPFLDGRESTSASRSSSMETTFIMAHGSLFMEQSVDDYDHNVDTLLGGLLNNYIGRAGPRFKEVGVMAALSNAAALFEYDMPRSKGGPRSILRLAFDEARESNSSVSSASQPTVESLTSQELESSKAMINLASNIAFGTLSIGLRRPNDKNVYPMIHTYLALLRGLTRVEKAMACVERNIPWSDIASFLTALATSTPESMTSKVCAEAFPRPSEGVGRPLPEDFVMRGQVWSEFYFPATWFQDAAVDDEERILELPSMAAPRVERLLWLGHGLATYNRWISYDSESGTFSTTQYAKELPTREIKQTLHVFPANSNDQDSIMSGIESEDGVPDSPPKQRAPSMESTRSELQLSQLDPESESPKKTVLTKPPTILRREPPRKHSVSPPIKREFSPVLKPTNRNSEEWIKGENYEQNMSPHKMDLDDYPSDPVKLEIINNMNVSDGRDPTKT